MEVERGEPRGSVEQFLWQSQTTVITHLDVTNHFEIN